MQNLRRLALMLVVAALALFAAGWAWDELAPPF
jgi:hypothetical protein